MYKKRTLFRKIWDEHVVLQEKDHPAVLYIDLHLIHEVTSPQAFQGLRTKGLSVRCPSRTLGTIDHSSPTISLSLNQVDALAAKQVQTMQKNCAEFGVPLLDLDHPERGIVHVVGPELGHTQPGKTIVCGDSHTATHGAFGALAFGIGTSEVEHVLATQCLVQHMPKTFRVTFEGQPGDSVTAKDMILALIAQIGVGGGTGYVIEYDGSTVRNMDMEARMTLCNMSIEGGARAGMIAPDDTTFNYMAGLPYVPQGEAWDSALTRWKKLTTDDGATFDKSLTLDTGHIQPMITYGTNPSMGIPVNEPVPDPAGEKDPEKRAALEKALAYMDLKPGQSLLGHAVDVVFIGSCTNGRLHDLRMAARLFKGRQVAEGVRVLVVPGSEKVRQQAEAEGLHQVFREAGAEWRYPGCSMCIAMNGDELLPGQYAVSTSNRNFENRQGINGRTFLASPLTAAAAAVTGCITDPRTL
ncbi:MAG: 3-isopropylmalate dehydratase large subunit [Anaerolineales bacterium]|nr:3-isopropylmalate dehydratase large subunit [Anaerolineales bacterium]